MFFPNGALLGISTLVLLLVFLFLFITSNGYAQNETTRTPTPLTPLRNDTSAAVINNDSKPIFFEVTSKSESGSSSNQSSFKTQISWIPKAIGSENTFGIRFLNSTSGEELQNVVYDVMLFNEGNHLSESHRSNQHAASQKYVFSEPGFYTLKIDNIGNTSSSIDLPMQVVPEFSSDASAMILVGGLLAILLLMARFKTVSKRILG
ncbi:MAG TPA: hypothetical protein VFR94_22540 [Nitrososphaeraceae archaeon]|nr:hypothetical protein [Nitrososphaeraceae archaeon]